MASAMASTPVCYCVGGLYHNTCCTTVGGLYHNTCIFAIPQYEKMLAIWILSQLLSINPTCHMVPYLAGVMEAVLHAHVMSGLSSTSPLECEWGSCPVRITPATREHGTLQYATCHRAQNCRANACDCDLQRDSVVDAWNNINIGSDIPKQLSSICIVACLRRVRLHYYVVMATLLF